MWARTTQQFYKIFTSSLVCAALAQLFYLIDQSVYSNDGIGVPGIVVFASRTARVLRACPTCARVG